MDVENSVDRIARELLAEEADERAAEAKQYLKSELEYYGVRVPTVRAVVTRAPAADRDELVSVAAALWSRPVFRTAAGRGGVARRPGRLAHCRRCRARGAYDPRGADLGVGRRARSEGDGPDAGAAPGARHGSGSLGRRRRLLDSACRTVVLLVPLRRGDGDFERFTWYADSMLDDKEFFVRKAIGWVLRDAGKKRPEMVYEWTLPRAARLSSVSFREAIKPLSNAQRAAVEAARIGSQ